MPAFDDRHSDSTEELWQRAKAGDQASIGQLLELNRQRLKRMVALRIDPCLQRRVDASDVVQESLWEAARRFLEYTQQDDMPFLVWLRLITQQRLNAHFRQHLGTQRRDAGREVSIDRRGLPAATSAALAARLLGKLTQPSEAAMRAEAKIRLQQAINQLAELDREILVLRHFEQLSAHEAALELGISDEAVKKRHVRALQRLKRVLTSGEPGSD